MDLFNPFAACEVDDLPDDCNPNWITEDISDELGFDSQFDTTEDSAHKILKDQDSSLNQPLTLQYLDVIYGSKLCSSKVKRDNITASNWRNYTKHLRSNSDRPTRKGLFHNRLFKLLGDLRQNPPAGLAVIAEKKASSMLKDMEPTDLKNRVFSIFTKCVTGKEPPSFNSHLERTLNYSYVRFCVGMLEFTQDLVNLININNMETMLVTAKQFNTHWGNTYQPVLEHNFLILKGFGGVLDDIALAPDFCYFPSINLLLDRTGLLMMKDIYLARRNSLLYVGTNESIMELNKVDKLSLIYLMLDKIVEEHGNPSYKGIKLLEPLCNAIMIDKAHSDTLLNLEERFKGYLNVTIEELKQESGVDMTPLKNMIYSLKDEQFIINVFGTYRHWGHPYIEWEKGLTKLREQVTMNKPLIDLLYMDKLASNLAKKIISSSFSKTRKWPVVGPDFPHPVFAKLIPLNMWPTKAEMETIGNCWHFLNITQIYDLPEAIPLADILSDKSHSLNRVDLRLALKNHSIGNPMDRKVLISSLKNEEINPIEFLTDIQNYGIEKNDLVIGLREKERELKDEGRFFSLMTLKLRTYFVITEHMIAQHIVPLFDALTMTDNLNKVFKKMINRIPGHGPGFPDHLTFCSHLDYQKWNNHQRHNSTYAVFDVMDRAFGLKNVISRTHEFFENSLIYYAGAPHLFEIDDDLNGVLIDEDCIVCWNGQQGGLEGLRQKGWSIVSLLMIEEEAERSLNADVKVLAQGDNQVICLTYKPVCSPTDKAWAEMTSSIVKNVERFVERITAGAEKLGLLIKAEETWTSYNYLIYGKVALYKRRLLTCGTKKWSRAGCLNNDQLPTFKNILSSIATSALTVTQHSESIVHSIWMYLMIGQETIDNLLSFTPLIESSPLNYKPDMLALYNANKPEVNAMLLLLDPSLGGLGGLNLLRFVIRQFPDGVTEALTFWKMVHDHSVKEDERRLCIMAGNPSLARPSLLKFKQLLDAPDSLNISRVAEASNIMKMFIGGQLKTYIPHIKNRQVSEVLRLDDSLRSPFLSYLFSITPVFPRFLSEFYDSTILGYKEGIVSCFQSSRTIRLMFKSKFTSHLFSLIMRSESENLSRILHRSKTGLIWKCSSQHADLLRNKSWGFDIKGSTVPHPAEYLSIGGNIDNSIVARIDNSNFENHYLGTCPPYLGSSTSGSSSLHKSYERTTTYNQLKKPIRLQSAINWFVPYGGSIWKTMCNNLQSFTDFPAEDVYIPTSIRTGSALHRFSAAKFSNGGYCATSHNLPTRVFLTTDSLSEELRKENHDFMFQASLLYAQLLITERLNKRHNLPEMVHIGMSETCCIRRIDDISLVSDQPDFEFPSLECLQYSYVPRDLNPIEVPLWPNLPFTEATGLIHEDISGSIGLIQGFLLGCIETGILSQSCSSKLFPVSLRTKLHTRQYLFGISIGILLVALIDSTKHVTNQSMYRRQYQLRGRLLRFTARVSKKIEGGGFLSDETLISELLIICSPQSAAYPSGLTELHDLLRGYLIKLFASTELSDFYTYAVTRGLIATSEIQDSRLLNLYMTGISLLRETIINVVKERSILGQMRNIISACLDPLQPPSLCMASLIKFNIRPVDYEAKSLLALMPTISSLGAFNKTKYKREYEGWSNIVPMESCVHESKGQTVGPRVNLPLMSGLRLIMYMTGAHYKLKCIMNLINIRFSKAWVIGDGSGGLTAAMLRRYPHLTVCFNSLIDPSRLSSEGVKPSCPMALMKLHRSDWIRCLNMHTVWRDPSDLCNYETWIKLSEYLLPDFILCDAQVVNPESRSNIARNLERYLRSSKPKVILWKSYVTLINECSDPAVNVLMSHYDNVYGVFTEFTSLFSSEVYILAKNPRQTLSPLCHLADISLMALNLTSYHNQLLETEMRRWISIKDENLIKGFKASLSPDNWRLSFSHPLERIVRSQRSLGCFLLDFPRKINNLNQLLAYVLAICVECTRDLWNTKKPKDLYPALPAISMWASTILFGQSVFCYYLQDLGMFQEIMSLTERSGGISIDVPEEIVMFHWEFEARGRAFKQLPDRLELDLSMSLFRGVKMLQIIHNISRSESINVDQVIILASKYLDQTDSSLPSKPKDMHIKFSKMTNVFYDFVQLTDQENNSRTSSARKS